VDACRRLEQIGFIIGTWGNVSIRLGDVFFLTPSRVAYDVLRPEDIVVVDMDGNKLAGEHNPSSEKEVHRLIYCARPDVGAVVHCHSVYATALSAAGRSIPPVIEEMSQLLGGGIDCTEEYVNAGRHHELGVIAAAAIGDKNACLLLNHGPVCCGRDLKEAMLCCLVTEKAATLYCAIADDLAPIVIPDEYVKSERHRYLYSYGKEK
jgi:L-fuculose-phosphate aldolase